MKQEKLKNVIRDEIEKVTKMMMCDNYNRALVKSWLLSLQRIDGVCKERNRY